MEGLFWVCCDGMGMEMGSGGLVWGEGSLKIVVGGGMMDDDNIYIGMVMSGKNGFSSREKNRRVWELDGNWVLFLCRVGELNLGTFLNSTCLEVVGAWENEGYK